MTMKTPSSAAPAMIAPAARADPQPVAGPLARPKTRSVEPVVAIEAPRMSKLPRSRLLTWSRTVAGLVGDQKAWCGGLTGLVAAAWSHAEPLQSDGGYQWSDFDPSLVAVVREQFPGLPPVGVALALRVWGRFHGLVSLEIYGHLRGQTGEPGKIYRTEILDLIRSLGLQPPA